MILGSKVYTETEGVYFDCGYILDRDIPHVPKYRVVKGKYSSNSRNYYEVDELVLEIDYSTWRNFVNPIVNFCRTDKYTPYTGMWVNVRQFPSKPTALEFIDRLIENKDILDDTVNAKALIHLASESEVITDA